LADTAFSMPDSCGRHLDEGRTAHDFLQYVEAGGNLIALGTGEGSRIVQEIAGQVRLPAGSGRTALNSSRASVPRPCWLVLAPERL